MTVKQLINKLKKMPEDAKILIHNSEIYVDGIYYATSKEGDRVIYEDDLDLLLPVQPKPKTGYWIRVDKNKVKCSNCEIIHLIAQYPLGHIDYCPNCGSRMKSEK